MGSRPKGFASEALGAALAWLDGKTEHEQSVCLIAPANAASLRLARKFGYGEDQTVEFKGEPTLLLTRRRAG
ncbi:GNAT family N-acetyltransferase [Consotaella aegiceratis]|uniref:GNAT family N-acetyltransferase n=1 Tax=Consotaella aegiceratis TaxID=3097961 RepID=UPI002F40CF75